ncbi:MAG: hypothetical protein FWE52_00335 [Alphaproteobacteria bacterium]|nr:hypothetical protein [Alphaproteobacteria bacterium]
MLKRYFPVLLGFYAFGAHASTNPPSGVWDNVNNTGAEITSGFYNYTSSGDMIVNGAFIVDSSADASNPTTATVTSGAFTTLNMGGTNDGTLSNASTGGLIITATNGISIANGLAAIINSAGTMTLDPGAGQTINAAALVSGPFGAIDIQNGTNFVFGGYNIPPGMFATGPFTAGGYVGLYSTGGLNIGYSAPGGGSGDIYFSSATDTTINITSDADVYIGGALNTASGYDLNLSTGTGSSAVVVTIAGAVNNNGNLVIGGTNSTDNISSITIGGTIISNGNMSLTTNNGDITLADVNSGGAFSATANGNLSLGSFNNLLATSGAVNLIAQTGNINATGTISNQATGATFAVSSGGDITIGGNLYNSGNMMTVDAPGAVSIAGTMKNDMVGGGGTLNIGTITGPVASLTVAGGDASNPSFANLDNFAAYVTGASNFAYGIDNGTAPFASTFLLQTGTLTFSGDDSATTLMTRFLQNNLNSFTLNIMAGDLQSQSISNGALNALATMNITAQHIATGDITSSGASMIINSTATDATTGIIATGNITNGTGIFDLISASDLEIDGTVSNAGTMLISGIDGVTIGGLVSNSNKLMITSATTTSGIITLNGGILNAGTSTATSCISGADCDLFVNAYALSITGTTTNNSGTLLLKTNGVNDVNIGALAINGGWAGIDVNNNLNINGTTMVASGAASTINSNVGNIIASGNITNDGNLDITAGGAFDFTGYDIIASSGANTHIIANTVSGGAIQSGDDFIITAANGITLVGGVVQDAGNMTFNTTSLNITNGGISAGSNLLISSAMFNNTSGTAIMPGITSGTPNNWYPWLAVDVAGDVSGAVKFVGLGTMNIGGNYVFGNTSGLDVAVLPASVYGDIPGRNYYATVNTDTTSANFGQITNTFNGNSSSALITVGGQFIEELTTIVAGQVGVSIFDIIDSGTAIWLLHADGGVSESLGMRNVDVMFCNIDGTKCFNYVNAIRDSNGNLVATSPITTTTDANGLPIYLTVRDGENIYIVFDSEFGGPASIFKIQPIVGRDPSFTGGEYTSAGALDNLVDGLLINAGFLNNTPVEAIPIAADGTIFATMAEELYKRMDYYITSRDTTTFTAFSKLFQPTELDKITAMINVSEHATRRAFSNRMFEEFLWNRNRNRERVWGDVAFGSFNGQASGDRIEITAGIDTQYDKSTILGIMANVNFMESKSHDTIDLSYGSVSQPDGFRDVKVTNTNIGLGAYMHSRINQEFRYYGNLRLNLDMFDISRSQTFMGNINGKATAFSVTTEWGLLHDLWLQYFVGNLYARAGYNFGFDIDEKVAGSEYMKLRHDGHFILTPGYELTAGKKIYMSPWVSLKPFIGVGVEYDVGGFNSMNYKFSPAQQYTTYDVDMSRLWLSGRVGAELAGVSGWHFTADYEYKYNEYIKVNTFRIAGAYRF